MDLNIRYQNALVVFNDLVLSELTKLEIKCWVAGGAPRNYFMGRHINSDVDIFFPDFTNFSRALVHFNRDHEVTFENDNAVKFKRKDGQTFDLIKKHFATPELTLAEFDFTVAQFAVTTDNVYFGEHSLFDLSKRQLMINKITYPYSTLHRMVRYLEKDFRICMGELDKIHDAIEKLAVVVAQSTKPVIDDDEENVMSSSSSRRGGFD